MPKKRTNDRYELERRRQLRIFSKEVSKMVRTLLEGKDEDRIAMALSLVPNTLHDKMLKGRFSAPEFLYLASLCGYSVKIEKKPPIDGVKEA